MNSSLLLQLKSAQTFLETLTHNVHKGQDVLKWFQQLCAKLCDLFLHIAKEIKTSAQPMNQQAKETMLLYLLQLNTTLSVLIKIFTTESEVGITINKSRQCIIQQAGVCLTGIENVVNCNNSSNYTTVGFVKYMDIALDKIAEIDVENQFASVKQLAGEARKIIEEVLCHAMSIAQVALKDDCNAIKGSSKQVLHNFDFLLNELDKAVPSISMANLFIDSVCDKLCALERKVNVAVLKLSLKVFSECTKPLEDLHHFCLRSRQDEDTLDEMIADFDLHVDRMIQVGLFAVSCSTDRNCTLKMRSCLASLEALEGELVPAMMLLIKDCTAQNYYHAEILKQYWVKQAQDLKKFIYLIIDPFAFCQVTFEVIKDINEELEQRFREVAFVDKNLVKPITLQTKILYEMLLVSLVDSPPENQDVIRKYLNDVISVTMEIDSAAEKLLSESDEMCKENVFRVFKRCKVQECILKKLVVALGSSIDKPAIKNNTLQKDIGVTSTHEQAMEEITVRGKQILKERSVLYKTPQPIRTYSNSTTQAKGACTPLSRLVHLRNIQFSHSRSVMDGTSCDLQITNILDDLTALSLTVRQ